MLIFLFLLNVFFWKNPVELSPLSAIMIGLVYTCLLAIAWKISKHEKLSTKIKSNDVLDNYLVTQTLNKSEDELKKELMFTFKDHK